MIPMKTREFEVYEGIRLKVLISGDEASFDVCLMEVEPNTEAPSHKHEVDEAFYIISGEIEFKIEEEEQVLKADDYIYVPRNKVHSAKSFSEKVKALVIHFPPRF